MDRRTTAADGWSQPHLDPAELEQSTAAARGTAPPVVS